VVSSCSAPPTAKNKIFHFTITEKVLFLIAKTSARILCQSTGPAEQKILSGNKTSKQNRQHLLRGKEGIVSTSTVMSPMEVWRITCGAASMFAICQEAQHYYCSCCGFLRQGKKNALEKRGEKDCLKTLTLQQALRLKQSLNPNLASEPVFVQQQSCAI
jgi:hypothetical protein